MRVIEVICHFEGGVWWGESEEFPGLSIAADKFEDFKRAAYEAVGYELVDARVNRDFDLTFRNTHGDALDAHSLYVPETLSWVPEIKSTATTAIAAFLPRSGHLAHMTRSDTNVVMSA